MLGFVHAFISPVHALLRSVHPPLEALHAPLKALHVPLEALHATLDTEVYLVLPPRHRVQKRLDPFKSLLGLHHVLNQIYHAPERFRISIFSRLIF